jgi:HD-GYP domain-containing protein (c-di-GMP phosphodiesterase class II)
MPENIVSHLPAIFAIAAAVIITVGSAYWSRVALPRQIDDAYRASLHALAAAVETKDSGTLGHARRVADYAVAIARDMGVHAAEVRRIERSALLRDIGKVNIPHSLLNKMEALTAEEFDIIKGHSKIGSDLVMQVPFLAMCADLIIHHHEKWDGTGYPDGLEGEEIPLGSRILAVANDFDAMASDRPYHKAVPPIVAVQLIKDGSGESYDPAVVDSFIRIAEKEEQKAA